MADGQYIVQHGDSLVSISKKLYGTEARWPELAELNDIAPPYTIYVGQVLRVRLDPGAATGRPVLTTIQPPSAGMAFGRGFAFLFTVDQLPDMSNGRRLIRKVVTTPYNFRDMGTLPKQWFAQPERAGMSARNPFGTTSLAQHAMGDYLHNSPYLSASDRTFGAPNIQSDALEQRRPLLIDVDKVRRAGGVVHSSQRLVAELRAFKALHPHEAWRIDRLIRAITLWEGETLIEGGVPREAITKPNVTHRQFITEAERLWNQHKRDTTKLTQSIDALDGRYKQAAKLGRGLRVAGAVGMVVTAVDVTHATRKSIDQHSIKPIGAEGVRQVGSWAAAWAGAKIGAVAGAAVGIETGPGAIVSGALGALIFGTAGYLGADWIADKIDEN